MNKARLNIATSKLVGNSGQLDWLPRNPRTWTLGDVSRTIKSITTDPDFLEDRPLLAVPAESGKGERYIVFAGNLRLKACKESNVKTAPVVVYFPESDEDRETVKRRAMLDNGSFGSWDYDALANEWDDLPLVDLGIPAWEPEQPDLQEKDDEMEVTEDDFDEETDVVKTRCRLGDIWQLGDHRLMCGDSTISENISRLLDNQLADLWLTDPPYNVDYQEKEQYKIDLGYAVSKHDVPIANDKMSDNEFFNFLKNAFAAAKENLRPGGVFYIWHADSEGYNFRRALVEIKNMKVAETLIWAKDRLCFGRQDYHWQHEPCLYGWKEGAGHKWYSDRSQTTLMNFKKPQKSELHPTMKPVELFAYEMKNSSDVGEIVLDTFGGSGTTIIAAEQLKRRAMVMELEPHYCDVILARWEKLTGEEAVKIV